MDNHGLADLKIKLKKGLSKGNKAVLTQLLDIVNQKTEIYNHLISIHSQLRELEVDEISGTIDENNRSLRKNRISQSIIKSIDNLQIQDLLWVDENNPSIKFLFEYISTYALLEHKNIELTKENQMLKDQIQQLKFENNEYKEQLKESEALETFVSEVHSELATFFKVYYETLSFYPKMFLVFQQLSKGEFFEEEVAQNLLDFYSKPLLRDLEYTRFFFMEIEGKIVEYDINGNAWPRPGIERQELFASYKKLNAFRLSLTTEVTDDDVEYLVEEAEKLLDELGFNNDN